LLAAFAVIAGTASVEAVKERSFRGVQKPPTGWDNNVSEVNTRPLLVSLGRRGNQQASKRDPLDGGQTAMALGGRPQWCGTPDLAKLSVQGLRRLVEMISSRFLTQMLKEHGPQCSNR
jgi:hypothetical protein